MERVLVSACLLGETVRYDGGHRRADSPILARWLAEGRVVAICPEVAGGLPIPRPAAEISHAAGGAAVLSGFAQVRDRSDIDHSAAFIAGARRALELAQRHGIRIAILKEGSPSCGSSQIHDGTFVGSMVAGQGIATALLRQAGLTVYCETQFDEAETRLAELESGGRQSTQRSLPPCPPASPR